jgi:CoA:oxalate CoA-transferase
MSITGTPETGPTKPGTSIADLSAGLYAFGAVCAALTGRDRTGRGSRVDIAMYDAALSLLEGAALSYLATGAAPAPIGNAHYSIAPFDTYPCADRQIVVCAANDRLFARLAAVLGRPDLLTEEAFTTNAGRVAARPALTAELSRTLRTRPAADWLDALHAAGVPAGPVNDVAEAVSSEQAAARRMVVRAGGLPLPGNPVKIGGEGGMPDPDELPAAPDLDADGPALRAEFA